MNNLALMQVHVETLFLHNSQGRLLWVNMPLHPETYPAPLIFIGRTSDGTICRCRHDLPADLCNDLAALARRSEGPPLAANPALTDQVRRHLEGAGWRIGRVWEGPAYYFPEIVPQDKECIVIDQTNADLLRQYFSQDIAELEAVQPYVAALIRGNAVSVCQTSRRSAQAAEAGVETIVSCRRHGLGVRVVARWANLVQAMGLRPMYSTSWNNLASQGLAAKLGLIQYGADLHLSEASLLS